MVAKATACRQKEGEPEEPLVGSVSVRLLQIWSGGFYVNKNLFLFKCRLTFKSDSERHITIQYRALQTVQARYGKLWKFPQSYKESTPSTAGRVEAEDAATNRRTDELRHFRTSLTGVFERFMCH
ncbi:hypothetical protein F2P81_010547 [Scophthalmus maximus]|uniref:Uncharacterized protein n=1 Tax=Scophthalmus maximus TaxID=52904 RepID=A0A6A4SUP1_SCOMX|nr:hypothetical protein F2P81_010547 [Scophthalmus maximus]